MSRSNNNRVNIVFEDADLADIRAEAKRLDAPLSWIVRQAWQLARRQIIAEGDAVEGVRAAFGAGTPKGTKPRPPPKTQTPPAPSIQDRPLEPLDHQERELWPWDGPTI
jgi:uncharacterized small protein (TIGR04563 family)